MIREFTNRLCQTEAVMAEPLGIWEQEHHHLVAGTIRATQFAAVAEIDHIISKKRSVHRVVTQRLP